MNGSMHAHNSGREATPCSRSAVFVTSRRTTDAARLETPAATRRSSPLARPARRCHRADASPDPRRYQGSFAPRRLQARGPPASRPPSTSSAALAEDRFPRINALVDTCNVVSLHAGLPISLVDADKLDPSARRCAGDPRGAAGDDRAVCSTRPGQVIDAGGLCASTTRRARRARRSRTRSAPRPTTTRARPCRSCGARARSPGRAAAAARWYASWSRRSTARRSETFAWPRSRGVLIGDAAAARRAARPGRRPAGRGRGRRRLAGAGRGRVAAGTLPRGAPRPDDHDGDRRTATSAGSPRGGRPAGDALVQLAAPAGPSTRPASAARCGSPAPSAGRRPAPRA